MTAGTGPQASEYDDVVDLSRYPINDPADPAYRALIQAGQDELRDQGVARLTGFLTLAAVGQMLTLASQLAAQAWASDQAHTVERQRLEWALAQRLETEAEVLADLPLDVGLAQLRQTLGLPAFVPLEAAAESQDLPPFRPASTAPADDLAALLTPDLVARARQIVADVPRAATGPP